MRVVCAQFIIQLDGDESEKLSIEQRPGSASPATLTDSAKVA